MKLENQVVSLGLSKELKSAGYDQINGFWVWIEDASVFSETKEWRLRPNHSDGEGIGAPTVAELGEALPIGYSTRKAINPEWFCESYEKTKGIGANTEANARAKMWLCLKKENLL